MTITIRAVNQPNADPLVEYTIDTGNDASKAFQSQDWAQLGRLQPANKRSKDPTRQAAARTRAASATAAAPAE